MTANELRCGGCQYWLGESAEPLVFVETVAKSADALVQRPRDLRLCKSCGRVNVFIRRGDLDAARVPAVASPYTT